MKSFLDALELEYQKYQKYRTAYEIIKPNTSSNTPMGKPPKQTKKPNTNGNSKDPRYVPGRW